MTENPWYRERWPWILMSGPAIVVVAGVLTAVIAVRSFDGLVVDDYYKQGLGVNRVTEREANARSLGISALVQPNEERTRVRVVVGGETPPLAGLRLTLTHPTLPGEDQSIALTQSAPGIYEGALRPPPRTILRVRLEDTASSWRLAGLWRTKDASLRLAPH